MTTKKTDQGSFMVKEWNFVPKLKNANMANVTNDSTDGSLVSLTGAGEASATNKRCSFANATRQTKKNKGSRRFNNVKSSTILPRISLQEPMISLQRNEVKDFRNLVMNCIANIFSQTF